MITKSDISALWLEACPSFHAASTESCYDHGEELLYVHAGAFAQHLLLLHRSKEHSEFPAIAAFIERLHQEGDPYVREFATVGLLEGIQNVWSRTDVSPEEFLPYLRPASNEAWHALDRFWAGEIPFVPDVTKERQSPI